MLVCVTDILAREGRIHHDTHTANTHILRGAFTQEDLGCRSGMRSHLYVCTKGGGGGERGIGAEDRV